MNAFVSEAAQLRQCLLPGLMNTSGPEKLPEFFDELEQDQSSSCTARLILHQLRWLDYIVKPQQLANTLIEPIVAFLKDWMQQHPNLTVPILDTLSNLTVHADSLDDVRQMVLDGLSSADVDDLAVMIKFLLQTVTTHTVDTTIFDIRQNLDMRALVRLQQTPQQSSDKPAQSPEALILESIKLGIQFHRFVHASWIKSLLALETPRGHKVIDLLVLLIFYSMASTKKKTEGIIRKKIMAGLITSRLIKEVLVDHAAGLASYWGTIVVLAESLLRSSQQDLLLTCCAQALYTHAFIGCDAYHRQEMIGSLVTHVGSGVADEMNVALQVLLTLAQKHPKELAVYSVFLKGILDYLDSLTLLQIRILFDVFNLLALKGNEHITDDSSLWSDINIVVRKQLSNPRVKYKKIGILGAMSSIKVLNAPDVCCEQSSGGAGSSTQGIAKQAPFTQ
ncbi:hypothetical protein DM01DRAFT_1362850 [Hesseltinella vesiculosa]|uniref:Uncharacterized protein n=1 Tax=Hesseltinella vesiculosa TaxID=101127 RepID=A0A1X2GI91_9FUNG|nr:hypothetical protein DM01DRAFT_1362850 [Hesseltinella vesiculosa]